MEWIQENNWSLIAGLFSLWALIVSKQAKDVSERANRTSKDSELRTRYDNIAIRKLQYLDEINNDRRLILSLGDNSEALLSKRTALTNRRNELLDLIIESGYDELDGDLNSNRDSREMMYESDKRSQEILDNYKEVIEKLYDQVSRTKILKRYDIKVLRQINISELETDADQRELQYKKIKEEVLSVQHTLEQQLADFKQAEAVSLSLEQRIFKHISEQAQKAEKDGVIDLMLGL